MRRHVWAPVILLLPCVVLAVIGWRMALAGISHYQSTAFLDAWRLQLVEPDARAWTAAHAAAANAVDLYPVGNGQYLDVLAQIYLWKKFQSPFGSQSTNPTTDLEIESSRRKAVVALVDAIEVRPSFPGAYARLAHAKLSLRELDMEFRSALISAQRLGPYQFAINAEVAEVGLLAWPEIDRKTRNKVAESAFQVASEGAEGRRRIFALMHHIGKDEVLCSHLSGVFRVGEAPCL